MYRTPAGLFQVPPLVNTEILFGPTVAYSYPFADAFVLNTVLAPPTLLNPVPPLAAGVWPVTAPPPKSTAPDASVPEVTLPSAIFEAAIVLAAKLPVANAPSTIASFLIFLSV